MTAEIVKIEPGKHSKWGGLCDLVCFKELETGRSMKAWLSTECRNYERWLPVLRKGIGARIKGYREKKPGLVDADSLFFIV